MKVAVLLLVALLAAPALAHNWLKSPPARKQSAAGVNQDAQVPGPCDTRKPTATSWTVVTRGGSVPVTWTENHGGTHTLTIVSRDEEDLLATTATKIATFTRTQPNGDQGENSTTLTVPGTTKVGHHVLQYKWSGYYNCADLCVIDSSMTQSATNPAIYRIAGNNGQLNCTSGLLSCDNCGTPVYANGLPTCSGPAGGAGTVCFGGDGQLCYPDPYAAGSCNHATDLICDDANVCQAAGDEGQQCRKFAPLCKENLTCTDKVCSSGATFFASALLGAVAMLISLF